MQFTYDDEQDYVARAMSFEYDFAQGGTSVYAHQVVVSVLVDNDGIVQGIRIVTDSRVSDRDRRIQVTLARNFEARYSAWKPACEDVPMTSGELPVGNIFLHELCTAEKDGVRLRLPRSMPAGGGRTRSIARRSCPTKGTSSAPCGSRIGTWTIRA